MTQLNYLTPNPSQTRFGRVAAGAAVLLLATLLTLPPLILASMEIHQSTAVLTVFRITAILSAAAVIAAVPLLAPASPGQPGRSRLWMLSLLALTIIYFLLRVTVTAYAIAQNRMFLGRGWALFSYLLYTTSALCLTLLLTAAAWWVFVFFRRASKPTLALLLMFAALPPVLFQCVITLVQGFRIYDLLINSPTVLGPSFFRFFNILGTINALWLSALWIALAIFALILPADRSQTRAFPVH